MYIIQKSEGITTPQLLTTATISVNNLTLSVTNQGDITIETGGQWKGTLDELTGHIADLYQDLTEVHDGEN